MNAHSLFASNDQIPSATGPFDPELYVILAITQTPVGVGHKALRFTQHCGRCWPGTAQINGNRQKNVGSVI